MNELKRIEKPKKKVNLDEKLWRIFSQYIRLRDSLKTTGTKEFCVCVTCGRRAPFSQIDAGHCFGRNKDGTKYEETNNHGQCRYPCNMDRRTHGRQYAHKLYIKMIYGEEELNRLEYLSKKIVVQRRDDWYIKKINEYNKKFDELNG